MASQGASTPAGREHQRHCPLGCVPHREYAGRIVWYYGNEPHGVFQKSGPLLDHMVVILPDRYKPEKHIHDRDYFACIVLSATPRYSCQWWRVLDTWDHSQVPIGLSLFVDANSSKKHFQFGKPTFAGIGVPFNLHRTCLHRIPHVGHHVQLHPKSLDTLLEQVDVLIFNLALAQEHQDPSFKVAGEVSTWDIATLELTMWGYAIGGVYSWGSYDWVHNCQEPDFDGPKYLVPDLLKYILLDASGLCTNCDWVYETRRSILIEYGLCLHKKMREQTCGSLGTVHKLETTHSSQRDNLSTGSLWMDDLGAFDLESVDSEADNLEADSFEADDFEADDFEADAFEADDFETESFNVTDPRTDDSQADVFEAHDSLADDFAADDSGAGGPWIDASGTNDSDTNISETNTAETGNGMIVIGRNRRRRNRRPADRRRRRARRRT